MSNSGPRRSRRLAVLSLALAAVVLQANKCSFENAVKAQVWPEIEDILQQTINKGRNWRLHWMSVDRGTTVSSLAVDTAGDIKSYKCQGKICVLFFLDLDPFAHFAPSNSHSRF